MNTPRKPAKKKHKAKRIKIHKLSYVLVLSVVVIIGLVVVGSIWKHWQADRKQADYQKSIQAFYEAPTPLPQGSPGKLVRSEKMDIKVPRGGTAYRMLYMSETPSGEPVAVSGVAFIPSGEAPQGGRKVIAWAHGTRGLGSTCAPSRSEPMDDMDNWLDSAMQRGYIVTATDYTGLGTSGKPYYLIGKSEANDVLNSVRAVRNMPQASASSDFIAWGHSQGGHSTLFAATQAAQYAPELRLVAAAVAAPAAELGPLMSQQYHTPVAWAIGPDMAASWPNSYPDLPIKNMLTKDGGSHYKTQAYKCLSNQTVGLTIRAALKSQFFASNPRDNPAWARVIAEQTPDVASIKVPLYIAQGLNDVVVLPNTTSLLVQQACATNPNVAVNWLGNSQHQMIAIQAGPDAVAWMQDRFNDLPAPSSCSQPLPVPPAS